MPLYASLLILLFFFGGVRRISAQRPSTASICDYYALNLYGANTSDTQFRLMQNIVSLAFAGGSALPNVSSDLTGILNPGTFNDIGVDLQPWFNGSIASTNLNNQPVGINWLDNGGVDPLNQFLTGYTSKVILSNTTNEYRLFAHFFGAFSHIFGCTLPQAPPPSSGTSSAPLSLAYVHKYMNLNFTDLGHFIDQLQKSTLYFGFSSQDAQTLDTQLNSLYNVRCAPAVNGQLLSLCQASSCPLAEPSPDCAAYVNLGPGGAGNGTVASQAPGGAASTSTSSSSPTTTSSSSSSQTSSSSLVSSSSAKLSSGAIAGISLGGAAVLLIGIGIIAFIFRRRKPVIIQPFMPPSTTGYASPSYTDPHTSSYTENQTSSYTSNQPWIAPPIAEMESESPRFARSPEMSAVREDYMR